MIATADCAAADVQLVEACRAGDDAAFEELYRRYHPRIAGFVRGMLHDETRAEDVAQEAFLSALRRMRSTDCEINFKPWIYQIARNAAIDSYRRSSHAVEVSMDADDGLRASDRARLVGVDGGPDAALITKERLNHLQGAFDELSDVHTRVLVMRELEGLSYREIGKKLDLTRPAVESALFRARRRLENEYTELTEGRRCEAMRATIARMASGTQRGSEEHRLARHAKRCPTCRRRAREQGVEPLGVLGTLRRKAAALLPLPWLFRRSGGGDDGGVVTGLVSNGAHAAPLVERAAALVAVAALAGAGGAALGSGELRGDREAVNRPAAERSAGVTGESQRGATGTATDGERGEPRRASGRERSSGPAGGRAGGSGGSADEPQGPVTGAGATPPALPAPHTGAGAPVDTTEVRLPRTPEVKAPSTSPPKLDVGVTTPPVVPVVPVETETRAEVTLPPLPAPLPQVVDQVAEQLPIPTP